MDNPFVSPYIVSIDYKYIDRGWKGGLHSVRWIMSLFEEIDEPTDVEKAMAVSMLLAEAESWMNGNIHKSRNSDTNSQSDPIAR